MTTKQYINQVLRQVDASRNTKRRLREDLQQDIECRIAEGKTLEQVQQEMGEPSELAAQIQEGCEPLPPHSTVEKVLLGVAAVFGLGCIAQLVQFTRFFSTIAGAGSIGIIGGADGPTAIFVTSAFNPWGLVPWVLAIVSVIAYMLLRHKRKKQK